MLDVLCVGHAAFDITMAVDRHPAADEKMQARAIALGGGGPAANAAVQVARLGGRAGFAGFLGRDLFGDLHLREFEAEGVDTRWLVRGDRPTPVSQILAKPDGTRSVVNYKGDTAPLPADAAEIPGEAARVFLFDGHEPELSAALLERARAAGRPSVLDAGSLHAGTRRLAPKVDVLAASARFARQWTGMDDVEAALERLTEVCATVVITLGAEGLVWARGAERGRVPAFSVPLVDSTGAGDAFHGALAWALARGFPWNDALRFASAAGALVCTKLGVRPALANRHAVTDLLARPVR